VIGTERDQRLTQSGIRNWLTSVFEGSSRIEMSDPDISSALFTGV
jgi:hypothetical protein